jgi:hypothetical protein
VVVVVLLVVVVVVLLVVVVLVVVVVEPRHKDSRHSPVCDPGVGGWAQGHSGGQLPPVQAEPFHVMTQGLPQARLVVVGGGGCDGGGHGYGQGVVV